MHYQTLQKKELNNKIEKTLQTEFTRNKTQGN